MSLKHTTRNGNHEGADAKNKPKTYITSEVNMENDTDVKTDQPTKQKNGDDSEDEAASGSSRSADDTPNNGVPKEIVGNRDSDKHDATQGPGGETYEVMILRLLSK